MYNEYGRKLDRNGYAPSILQLDCECWLCGKQGMEKLDRHEVFGGPYRSKSKRLGLWVLLHHESCHIFGPEAVHSNGENARRLKAEAQRAAMKEYGWTVADFRREFGKNYLEAEP